MPHYVVGQVVSDISKDRSTRLLQPEDQVTICQAHASNKTLSYSRRLQSTCQFAFNSFFHMKTNHMELHYRQTIRSKLGKLETHVL